MWKILQHKKPDDFVIATGKQYSIRQLIETVGKKIGIKIYWKKKGLNEYGVDKEGKKIVKVSKKFLRPSEVDTLLGDYKKAKTDLGWKPKIKFEDMIEEMIQKKMEEISK